MPYDISGNFTRSYNWTTDKGNGIKILSTRMDGEFDNYATALNAVLLRSGIAAMTGSLNLGGNQISALGNGTAGTPAIRLSGDATTGIYSTGVGKINIAAGAVNRIEANSTGVLTTGTLGVSGALSAASASFTAPLPYGSGGTGTNGTPINGQLLIGNGGGFTLATITAGSGVSVTNGAGTITLASTALVSSVDVSGGTTGLTTSGGPITGSGTITLAGTLGVGNGGTGSGTAGGARTSLGAAALGANGDITSLGALSTPLSVAQGGTGANNATSARSNLGLGSIATFAEATAAQYRSNTAGLALSTDKVWLAAGIVALTDAATIAIDMNTFINGEVTLAGNRTLGVPSNAKPGQSGFIRIIQDATGTRTLSILSANNWKSTGGVSAVLSTAAGTIDVLKYIVHTSTFIEYTLTKDVR